MFKPSLPVALVVALSVGGWFARADTLETPGRIDEVTVYRGQALVSRLVETPAVAGLHEIVVTELPDQIVPGSLHAESTDGVVVRSVRYRVRPAPHDVRDEVRKLDEQIVAHRDELDALQRRKALITAHRAFIDRLENFTAPTAEVELTRGVLNADVLKALTLFVFERRDAFNSEELDIDRQHRAVSEKINLLERERGELTSRSAKTLHEAIALVDVPATGGNLRLRYLVNNATWAPSYNVRSNGRDHQVWVEYNAAIAQRTGEDWSDVSMTLSTATPALVSKSPRLDPMSVALTAEYQPAVEGEGYAEHRKQIMDKKKQVEDNRNSLMFAQQQQRAGSPAGLPTLLGNRENDIALNCAAAELQMLDLLTSRRPERGKSGGAADSESISISYSLPARVSLPSRSDQQSIQIAALELPAAYYKIATPVLTEFVYDEAEVINQSEMVLLAGPVSAYAAGRFVGHDEVPTVAVGERFTLGFGIDTSLRTSKELVDRKERIQGGNRVVTFNYRLTVENFNGQAADLRILDRLPKAKETQVRVTLAENGHTLSEDRTYRQSQHKEGILRWDANVPASATGPDAFAIDYEFLLEYDKAMSITGLAMALQ